MEITNLDTPDDALTETLAGLRETVEHLIDGMVSDPLRPTELFRQYVATAPLNLN